MSYMFEVYCKAPADLAKEATMTRHVAELGGRLDYREEPSTPQANGVCLTYEFDELDAAMKAASVLRNLGMHVEGPAEYAA